LRKIKADFQKKKMNLALIFKEFHMKKIQKVRPLSHAPLGRAEFRGQAGPLLSEKNEPAGQ